MRSSRAGGNWRRGKKNPGQGKSRSVLVRHESLGFVKQARRSCVMCGWWGERGTFAFQSHFSPFSYSLQKKMTFILGCKSEGWFAIINGEGCVRLQVPSHSCPIFWRQTFYAVTYTVWSCSQSEWWFLPQRFNLNLTNHTVAFFSHFKRQSNLCYKILEASTNHGAQCI